MTRPIANNFNLTRIGVTWKQTSAKRFISKIVKHDVMTHQEIANMFGVSRMTITDISHRRTWRNI